MSKLSLSVVEGYVTIAQAKRVKKAEENAHVAGVRGLVFDRARGWCECCLGRPADTMHERTPKSVVGDKVKAVTLENSMAVCGDGTSGCHGHLQAHRIVATFHSGTWTYEANPRNRTLTARRWLEAGWRLFDQAHHARRGGSTLILRTTSATA